MISSVYGAMCLLENSGTDGMDTYRLSSTDWATAVAAFSSTEADVVAALKGTTNAFQDVANSNTSEWFQSLKCTGSTPTYKCTGWQPDW